MNPKYEYRLPHGLSLVRVDNDEATGVTEIMFPTLATLGSKSRYDIFRGPCDFSFMQQRDSSNVPRSPGVHHTCSMPD